MDVREEISERRQMRWRHIDRTAPRIDDWYLREALEQAPETFGRFSDRARIACERIADDGSSATATSAESDAAIAGGPEVADGCAQVAHDLTAGPMNLFEQVGRRR